MHDGRAQLNADDAFSTGLVHMVHGYNASIAYNMAENKLPNGGNQGVGSVFATELDSGIWRSSNSLLFSATECFYAKCCVTII